mmetsp:Transcript_26599/g.33170  ORF Transcript_26599/g.33170 Transcript_26599/m.33170 type:complete len:96 (+) Transcript_26599:993-1280(+)
MEVIETEDSTTFEFDLTKVFDRYIWHYIVEFWRDNFSDEDRREIIYKPVVPGKEYGIQIPEVDSQTAEPEQSEFEEDETPKKYGIHFPGVDDKPA